MIELPNDILQFLMLVAMPESISITFRDQTTGRINDLLSDEDKACANSQNLLGYLAGALLNYKDEGVEFSPEIIFCDNIELILQSFPGSINHVIGTAKLDPLSGPKILKECGPISSQNWCIFIERFAEMEVRFGIFTYFRLPTTIPLYEGITLASRNFCILLRKISPNTIEFKGSKGSNLTLIFSTVREAITSDDPIRKFTSACCLHLSGQEAFKIYLSRMLESALAVSHGTILFCAESSSQVAELHDQISVLPQLDLYTAFSEFQTANTAGSILTLQRCEELLQGFLRCDGMIRFDTKGRVTAYRVFYRPTHETPPDAKVIGGARRRAFEGVKALVGKQIVSVLFRSQDGLTLHYGAQA